MKKNLSIMKKVLFGIGLVTFLASCSYRVVDFTIISTKNVDLSKAGTFTRGKTRVEGKDVAHMIINFPLGRPSMKEAIDKAIETTPGAVALVDGVVYSKGWWAVLYGQDILVIEGIPLIDPSLASNNNNLFEDYTRVHMDKKGNVLKVEKLSKDEFDRIKEKSSK